jgi:hypothetical protein
LSKPEVKRLQDVLKIWKAKRINLYKEDFLGEPEVKRLQDMYKRDRRVSVAITKRMSFKPEVKK